ncbi:MAG: DNA-3-methyladenine glycosylase [Acidimicrobiia bacterium]
MSRTLPRSFYTRDARELAPLLLNKLLVSREPTGELLSARIVEVEAYRGAEDAASHAYRGMTKRNATMFGPAGHLYVYFTYGMHWCANVVAREHVEGSAVLLRGAAPVRGIELMRSRRVKARRDRDLLSGPARLCQAFAITGVADGTDLTIARGALRIVDDDVAPPPEPRITTRIGISPGRADDYEWRFCVPGDPNVSR